MGPRILKKKTKMCKKCKISNHQSLSSCISSMLM